MHDAEIWQDVEIAPGYQVSSHGRVRSFRCGRDGYVLKPYLNDKGYYAVTLWVTSGSNRPRSVHSLVANAFLEKGADHAEVRHLDGVRTNNHVSNLAWGTKAENTLDSVGHGSHNNARKSCCPQGHPYDLFYTRPNGQQIRGCKQCRYEAGRRRAERDKAAK